MSQINIHELEQKALALIAFMTSHMAQIEQVKKDIQDLFVQIAALKEDSQKK